EDAPGAMSFASSAMRSSDLSLVSDICCGIAGITCRAPGCAGTGPDFPRVLQVSHHTNAPELCKLDWCGDAQDSETIDQNLPVGIDEGESRNRQFPILAVNKA